MDVLAGSPGVASGDSREPRGICQVFASHGGGRKVKFGSQTENLRESTQGICKERSANFSLETSGCDLTQRA